MKKTFVGVVALMCIVSCRHISFTYSPLDVAQNIVHKYTIKSHTDLDLFLNLYHNYDSTKDLHIFMECRYPSLNVTVLMTKHNSLTSSDVFVSNPIIGLFEYKGQKGYIHTFSNCQDSIDVSDNLMQLFYKKINDTNYIASLPNFKITDNDECKEYSFGIISILSRFDYYKKKWK